MANYEKLESKYRNHSLINDKTYRDCMECHLKPDLLLIAIGSHSKILNK